LNFCFTLSPEETPATKSLMTRTQVRCSHFTSYMSACTLNTSECTSC
jgi:hypothetical protein